MHRVAGLVLAAGAGRRFGDATPKQLAPLDGRPLLEHALAAMAAAPGLVRVAVTLGARADEVLATVDLHGATPVRVPDWAEGQAASLRAGVAALAPHADAIVVTLGDQPRTDPAAIARLAAEAAGPAPAARATYDGVPGHPVLLTRALFPAIARLHGDTGARELLAGATLVPCDRPAPDDVDTPAQLAALRDGIERDEVSCACVVPFTLRNLRADLEDVGAGFDGAPDLEFRLATAALGLEQSGLGYQRVPPGYRFPYGHTHDRQEEVYVVVRGSGRMKLDDEIVELKAWDAVRVPPGTWRGYEAGPEGLELLVIGAPNLGADQRDDVEGQRDWWTDA